SRQLFSLSCVLSVRESGWRAGRGFRAVTTRTPQHGAFEGRINLCTVASDSGCSSVVAAAGLGRSGFGAPGEPSRDLADGVAQLLDRRRDPVASRLECRPTRGGRLGAATAEASRHRVVAGAEVEAGPDEALLRAAGSEDTAAGGVGIKWSPDGDARALLGD